MGIFRARGVPSYPAIDTKDLLVSRPKSTMSTKEIATELNRIYLYPLGIYGSRQDSVGRRMLYMYMVCVWIAEEEERMGKSLRDIAKFSIILFT